MVCYEEPCDKNLLKTSTGAFNLCTNTLRHSDADGNREFYFFFFFFGAFLQIKRIKKTYLAIYSSDEEKEAKRRNNGREKVCVFVCRCVEFYVDKQLKQNVRRTNVKFKKEARTS